MKHRNKSFNDYRGFSGPDMDIETSLREYGIIWKKVKKTEYLFIYGIDVKENENRGWEYNRFSYAFMSEKNWKELCNESWFELSEVCEYCDSTQEDFIAGFPYNVHSAVSYHGTENIFGSNYDEGYTIGGEV